MMTLSVFLAAENPITTIIRIVEWYRSIHSMIEPVEADFRLRNRAVSGLDNSWT